MNRRARFFAVQAVLTAVLMGVIVVTLISPNGGSTLFGVDVPGAGAPVAQGPPLYEPAGDGGQGGGGGASGAADGGPVAGETGGGGVAAPPPAGVAGVGGDGETPPLTPTPAPDDDGPAGPPGDQYSDTLARLSDAVN